MASCDYLCCSKCHSKIVYNDNYEPDKETEGCLCGVCSAALQAATRRVVEAAQRWKSAKEVAVHGFSEREPGIMKDFLGGAKALLEQNIAFDELMAALADPVLVKLRRE
jgi:hypothetical protein